MHVVHARRGEVSTDPFAPVPDDIAVVGYMCEVYIVQITEKSL